MAFLWGGSYCYMVPALSLSPLGSGGGLEHDIRLPVSRKRMVEGIDLWFSGVAFFATVFVVCVF